MTDDLDEFLDSMVHGCAVAAFCHQAAEEGRWPPDVEATKHRFNRYYEEELAAKNRRNSAAIAPEIPAAATSESVQGHAASLPLTRAQSDELNRRLDALESGEMAEGEPWDVVRKRVSGR